MGNHAQGQKISLKRLPTVKRDIGYWERKDREMGTFGSRRSHLQEKGKPFSSKISGSRFELLGDLEEDTTKETST